MSGLFSGMQRFGRALMLPIAVLPIAGLLLRLGQPDLLDLPAVAAAGQAIFANLGILFAIGIAVGIARENHGAAGLASVVCYFVATRGAEVLAGVPAGTLTKLSVPAGLIAGSIAGWLYNRYSELRLPSYLAFFGGRRFVPIVAGVAGLVLAAAFGWGWPALERGMDTLSRAILDSGEIGLFVYGVLNRFLIITGLHHVLNNLAWFLVGDYGGVTGDLNRFFAGDPTAGVFMSGFFPVMMFGLPAACLAMYHAAHDGRRRAAGGLLLSMALTSFLTGVTEPIEFTFVFLAPVLYALHAVLTGTAMVLMDLLGVRLGFGFSAGLFDYLLNYGKASEPLLMLPVGALYFGVYYAAFRFVIGRFDLKTPGREADEESAVQAQVPAGDAGAASAFVEALGGASNIRALDACTTRLRVSVVRQDAVEEAALRRLGARGVVRPSSDAVQVVIGPVADQLAGDIRRCLTSAPAASGGAIDPDALLAALGGARNVESLEIGGSRLLFTLCDDAAVDENALDAAVPRGFARPARGRLHALAGPGALDLHAAIKSRLANPVAGSHPASLLALAVFVGMSLGLDQGASAGESRDERVRAREIGLAPGILQPGALNAITDVEGVLVGHATVVRGASVRTGVTVVRPHGGNLFQDKVPAGLSVANGFGKLMGATQIEELGEIETPIVLTNTLSVGRAAEAVIDWTLAQPGNESVTSVNAIVGETNDSALNDIRARGVTADDVRDAIRNARTGPVQEGSVGAGTGTMAFGWKGGIGTSSRRLTESHGGYTVGALVQSNFGGVLQMDGVPVGRALGRHYLRDESGGERADGSIMIVIATDAPLSDRNLERLARRAFAGVARTGSAFTNGSGDYAIAFSTAPALRRTPEARSIARPVAALPNDAVSPLFVAAAEATEEAVYNSLLMATTVESEDARTGAPVTGEAIDLAALRRLVPGRPGSR